MKQSSWKEAALMKIIPALFSPNIIYDDEKMRDNGVGKPCVIICNHQALGDGPLLRYAFANKNVCSLMAKDIMDKPLMRSLISGCGCIPVDRNAAATAWIHDCVREIKNGSSVIIFPEGTTIKEHDIEPFKLGFILLAKMAGADILPTAICRKNGVTIRVGKPTPLAKHSLTRAEALSEAKRFEDIVRDMFLEISEPPLSTKKEITKSV